MSITFYRATRGEGREEYTVGNFLNLDMAKQSCLIDYNNSNDPVDHLTEISWSSIGGMRGAWYISVDKELKSYPYNIIEEELE